MAFPAFLDACVLVPARLRDMLLSLGMEGLFAPRWSGGVLEEVRRHLPDRLDDAAKGRLFAAMESAFPDAEVQWPGVVEVQVRVAINEKDRHVVAAALWGSCDVVVTADFDLAGEVERILGLESQCPDAFLAFAVDADRRRAVDALVDMARRRWLPAAERSLPQDQVVSRLARWCERQELKSTAHVLGGRG